MEEKEEMDEWVEELEEEDENVEEEVEDEKVEEEVEDEKVEEEVEEEKVEEEVEEEKVEEEVEVEDERHIQHDHRWSLPLILLISLSFTQRNSHKHTRCVTVETNSCFSFIFNEKHIWVSLLRPISPCRSSRGVWNWPEGERSL